MTMTQERKKITALPSGWPSKGMLRADIGDYIILAHPDRNPQLSKDGRTWEEANLYKPEHNTVISIFERRRWAK